ncbi:MAG: hypothetical protein WCF06_04980 [Nitrososphaeraceae archaeon]
MQASKRSKKDPMHMADDVEANDKDRLAMKKHFIAACRYELLFWDTAYGS